MIKVSIVRTDKNGQKHLSTLGLPTLMERILKDNPKESVTTFREHRGMKHERTKHGMMYLVRKTRET